MTSLWLLLLSLNTITPAQSVDFSKPSFLSVKSGERVTLNCSFRANDPSESLFWYKQIFGEMPQKVGEKITYQDINISPMFNTSGIKMEQTENGVSLTISHVKKEDGGFYYCGKVSYHQATFITGTVLAVRGDGDGKVSVIQSGVLDSVPAGASVTLQCSVLSESRAAEHQVLWFRAASPQSHPQIIYTHHNSSRQCESGSSTHTCVYDFSKNILSINDTGTYYCTVAVCGKIIFGNGTRVQLENSPKCVIYLAVVVAVCVVVIFAQAFIICKMRNCEQIRVRSQRDCVVEETPNQGRDAVELNYAALHFKKNKTKRVTRKREKPDCIYSEVSSGT
ncbi:uncharacterized protein LOC132890327 [Neoarius graeffei]|uniref:uncharacterized protein LOC132890327 n=1 Tax=Neoarius graeffei TaxID=443677 RepID=UPI00298C11D5|nr:uncharacterized protein LOC132890327 [Neoarius graeffei]